MWETDEQIVLGMQQRSKRAFQLFYERHIDYVYRIVIGMVKDRNHALDVTQELFLEFYLKAHTYNPERGSVKAWIAVKARSRSIDFLRKNQCLNQYEELKQQHVQTNVSPQEVFIEQEERKRMMNHLWRLPAQQRNVIVDNYFHELSHSQIAAKMNKPLGTVKSMIRYGIQNLRKLYALDSNRDKEG